MSKSELKDAQKKRKRQDDGAVEVPKKSKKSKQSADADVESASIAAGTKEKKDKKAKKAKNQASSEDATLAADDEPMSGTISGDERKKKKKDKKDKKEKKSSKAETDAAEDAPAVDSSPEKKDKKSKKDKKEKKSKKSKGDDDTAEPIPVDGAVEDLAAVSASEKTSKKDKKSKKEKKSKKDSDVPSEEGGPTSAANGADGQAEQAEAETNGAADVDQEEAGQNGRFIVFIGNLPFSTTKEQIEEHFAKLKPFEVRLRTYKDSGKSMGCGFIEFERFDHMQTALLKFHHSVIDDPKKKEGRKINVELSAGGGGNTEARVAKISAKNEKLANERQRNHEKRAEIEGKQQERKAKKEALKGKNGEVAGEAAAEEPENAGIHPARLAMLAQPERPQKQFKPNMGNVPKWKGGPPARGPKRY